MLTLLMCLCTPSSGLAILHESNKDEWLPANGQCVPLYCIASIHSLDYIYEWKHGQKPLVGNSPVMWVNSPGTYTCVVSADGMSSRSKCFMVHNSNKDGEI